MRTKAAEIGRELLWEHRLHTAGDVDGAGALRGVVVERRAGGDVGGHVGDVDPRAHAVGLAAHAEGVVEVLRLLWVDREREEPAEVDAIRFALRWVVRKRRVLPAQALVPEQPFENGLDVARGPEDPLEPGAPAPRTENDEVADGRLPRPPPVDHDLGPGLEVRLADEELAAPGELTDQELVH
jgi:hypothetical protein